MTTRERYIGEFPHEHVPSIVERANRCLRELRLIPTRASRFDWLVARRCVEHAAAQLYQERGSGADPDPRALAIIVDPKFLTHGYDHVVDGLEADVEGTHAPQWVIDESHVAVLLDPSPNLWSHMKSALFDVPETQRVRTVERLARYLTRQEVPFLVDLLIAAQRAGLDVDSIESAAMARFIDTFWTTPEGRPWTDLIRTFLLHLHKLDEGRRQDLLEGAIAAGEFARHTAEGESRERLREAFNTPLFPMVLVANEIMQEGLDLHQQCARIVHHDLAWNPAQLEQRVGRIDRLGSLVHRKRSKDKDATLDIVHPLIDRTIDMRLDRTVRAREKWLEFVLGAPRDFGEFSLADEPVVELPDGLSEALKVDLGP